MTDARRRVERAIRWAPEADRVRYAEEWRHDMASAASSGHRADDVARAAARMAEPPRSLRTPDPIGS